MTLLEIKQFREEFASIVYWEGMIKNQSGVLRRLEAWNKGGSHDKAIINAINVFKGFKVKLKDKLKGKSYNEWKDFSKELSTFKNKINRSVHETTKQKWILQLEELKWKI